MSHNTVFGGVSREIEGGTPLIGGVAREIESGLVLVGGVAREIEFEKKIFTVKCTGNNDAGTLHNATIGGTTLQRNNTVEVEEGTEILCTVKSDSSYFPGAIRLDGVGVGTQSGSTTTYTHVVTSNVTIHYSRGVFSTYYVRGFIDITTS